MAVSASRFPLTTVQCRQTCFSNSKIEPFVPFFKRCIRTLQTHKLLISNVMHFVLYSEVHLFCICLLLLFVLVLFFVFVFSPRDVKQYFSVSKLVVKLWVQRCINMANLSVCLLFAVISAIEQWKYNILKSYLLWKSQQSCSPASATLL